MTAQEPDVNEPTEDPNDLDEQQPGAANLEVVAVGPDLPRASEHGQRKLAPHATVTRATGWTCTRGESSL